MSRRNNIKVIGIPEHTTESWEESEALFKSEVKKALNMDEELHVERAHGIGSKRQFVTRRDGSRVKAGPRPIAVKMTNWKQKEKVIKKAREIKPANVKFLEDFSQRTLDKRSSLIPKLEEARRVGKIAYFIADRLVIKEKPPDIDEDDEVTINHGTT